MALIDHSDQILEGRYRLVRKIGEGGMGSVYLGEHVVIGRLVAVKLLRGEHARSARIVKRFYREAHAAAAIKHKNVIDIFDVGVSPWDEPYLVMEHLTGESLGRLLARHPRVDLAAACAVLVPTLLGLEAAHRAGVVHRDLKPENIFIAHDDEDGYHVKIIDFGISKFMGDEKRTKLTISGALLGTPDYMSPEQARGQDDVDARTDIYAAGVILYEMLVGKRPFEGDNYAEVLSAVLAGDPKPPSAVLPDFPKEAEPLIMRALSREREDRFANASDMRAALELMSCYGECRERLASYAGGAPTVDCAVGDLGEGTVTVTAPDRVAARILDEFARAGGTPGGWAVTGRRPRTLPLFAIIIFLASAIVGIGLALFLGVGRDEKPIGVRQAAAPAQPQPVPQKAAAEGVRISVEGAPAGAKIYYQDVLVPVNPFPVDKKETIAALRVEAEGFKPYAVGVIPSRDMEVRAELEPLPPESAAKAARRVDRPVAYRGIAPATVPAEKADLDGQLTLAQRQIVYTRNKRQLKECYDQALARGDAPRDEVLAITMTLDVAPSGVVSRVSLTGPGANITWLKRCLEQAAETWTYPPGVRTTEVEYSFAFTTSG